MDLVKLAEIAISPDFARCDYTRSLPLPMLMLLAGAHKFSMVKQEDEYAKQNNTQYPRSAEYDVTLPESSIRIKMADGLPDFFI